MLIAFCKSAGLTFHWRYVHGDFYKAGEAALLSASISVSASVVTSASTCANDFCTWFCSLLLAAADVALMLLL